MGVMANKVWHVPSVRWFPTRFVSVLRRVSTLTVKEMVLGVVGTFKDHRSLAHTLQDSEHIAQKLGLIIMCVILFILFVSEMPSVEKSRVWQPKRVCYVRLSDASGR